MSPAAVCGKIEKPGQRNFDKVVEDNVLCRAVVSVLLPLTRLGS